MTTLEAIREELRPYPVRGLLIEKKCLENGLNPLDDYSNTGEEGVQRVTLSILSQMVALNNVAEGGVTISFNKEEVTARINRLCNALGLDSNDYISKPTVKYLGDL